MVECHRNHLHLQDVREEDIHDRAWPNLRTLRRNHHDLNENICCHIFSFPNGCNWNNLKSNAYHDSADRRRANRCASVSLADRLDPVKIYHVVDIRDNLDGV